jgi:peptidoglycan/LPS O-acetylase OafA/YrhL
MLTVDPATQSFVDLTDPSGSRLSHLPGLDGLRGVAVIVVVAFHAGFDRMVGGYLGVSTFFTLSGFLITSLLLSEARRAGTVDLRAFWGRRFRRLMPASLVTLAAVAVLFGPFVATADQRASLRGGVLSALFEVANWYDIVAGNSYAALFSAPSPVLHFWSLAIEEQFYLLFPVLLLVIWRLARGSRGLLAAGLGASALASFVEPFVWSMSDDRIYYGTDTRAAELLLGALLAVVLSHRPLRRRLALRLRWRTAAITLGAVALAVQAWWWWSVPQTSEWLYRGGFGLYALMSCAVILAASLPSGPMRTLMSWPLLRWFGQYSYGIYLVHWPIFLTVRQRWPDAGRWAQTVVAVAATLGVAVLSYRFVEQPVRARRWPPVGRAVPVAGLAVVVVAALAFVPLPVDRGELATSIDETQSAFDEFLAEQAQTSTTAGPTTSTTAPEAPIASVGVYGDSTGMGLGLGFGHWAAASGAFTSVPGDTRIGCPVARFEAIKPDDVLRQEPYCASWPTRWRQIVADHPTDIALLVAAVWHTPDVLLPGASDWSAIGDPEVDRFIHDELQLAVDVLSSSGALVVLVTWPQFATPKETRRSEAQERQWEPERMARYNEILAEVAAERPDTARVIDLAGWMGDRWDDRTLRPDGTHFLGPTFQQVSGEWFGPELDRIWQAWWETHRAPGAATGTAAPAD